MAPFRNYTMGYTGQTKSAYRDFKVNAAYHTHIMKKINDTITSEFTGFESAYQCTQFIRGELYFYVDSMITLTNIITSDDLPMIIDLIRNVLELILTWLRICPEYKDSFRESQSNSQ
jgi:hypothetical protein